jgi:hypothetical protein
VLFASSLASPLRSGKFSGNCNEYFMADYKRFGCGRMVSCCQGSKCANLKVIDGGPGTVCSLDRAMHLTQCAICAGCWVEDAAGKPVIGMFACGSAWRGCGSLHLLQMPRSAPASCSRCGHAAPIACVCSSTSRCVRHEYSFDGAGPLSCVLKSGTMVSVFGVVVGQPGF